MKRQKNSERNIDLRIPETPAPHFVAGQARPHSRNSKWLMPAFAACLGVAPLAPAWGRDGIAATAAITASAPAPSLARSATPTATPAASPPAATPGAATAFPPAATPAAPAASTPAAAPPAGESARKGEITWLSGGIGEEGRDAMHAAATEYNVHVLFSSRQGSYLADIPFRILTTGGEELLAATSEGPLLYLRLPAGNYRVSVKVDDAWQTRSVRVLPKGYPVSLIFLGRGDGQ